MIKTLYKIFTGMMTESDNSTHDLFRYLAVMSTVVGLSLEVFTVIWQHKAFDFQTFGIGVGVLFGGVGAALALKPEAKGALIAP